MQLYERINRATYTYTYADSLPVSGIKLSPLTSTLVPVFKIIIANSDV